MNIIPIFYDTTSRKSILTFSKPSEVEEHGPDSIVKLAKDAKLDHVYCIGDTFHSFMEAQKNCKSEGISHHFGLEVWICNDVNDKSDESRWTEHKIIIWALNSAGYEDLVKIYTTIRSTRDNFYYHFRYDLDKLKALWTDNLMITLPFFDSFIAANALKWGAKIVPNFPVAPVFMREVDTGIITENQINLAIDRFQEVNHWDEMKVKTVYYAKAEDFKAYTVYRTIEKQSEFSNPDIEFFSSNKFSFENWKENEGIVIEPAAQPAK